MITKNSFSFLIIFFLVVASFNAYGQKTSWVAPDESKELVNPVAENKKSSAAKKGAAIFKSRCVFCHGAGAKGDGAAGARLNPKPADLTSARVQDQKDGEIFWKMSNGKGSMPAWGNILSEEERWNLVSFIRSL